MKKEILLLFVGELKKLLILTVAINFMANELNAQDRTLRFEMQYVTINDFEADGYILSIGGGGEGTIGRLKSSQVIAVDISKRELEEAPDGPLKIIMDARDLKFLDKTFNTVTCFFTLMYIDGNDHEKVFSEMFRVLRPGGKLLLWGAIIPKQTNSNQDRVLVPLTVKLPQKEIQTGYGVRLPQEYHDLSYYIKMSEKVGFKYVFKESENQVFHLIIQKPSL